MVQRIIWSANVLCSLFPPLDCSVAGFIVLTIQTAVAVVLIFDSYYLTPSVPLLSRILPSDACKIYKQGLNIR